MATHPIAGALCRRVIWRAQPACQSADQPLSRTALAAVGDTTPATNDGIFFRPLEDGTFTDVNDNSIELGDTDTITVAHSSLMDRSNCMAWEPTAGAQILVSKALREYSGIKPINAS